MDDFVFVEEEVAKAVKSDITFCGLCHIEEVPPGRSVKVPPGLDWKFDPYEIKLEPGDKVILEVLKFVRAMKGDATATACNINFESWASSAEAILTRGRHIGPSDRQQNSWEFLLSRRQLTK